MAITSAQAIANDSTLSVEGGTAVYATASELPFANNTAGDQAFVTDTSKLYIWTGNSWAGLTLTNVGLSSIQGGNVSYTLADDGTPTTITFDAYDSNNVKIPANWTYAVTSGSLINGGGSTATVTQKGSSFVITPTTTKAFEGNFSLTFTASDGVNSASANTEVTLQFSPPNAWDIDYIQQDFISRYQYDTVNNVRVVTATPDGLTLFVCQGDADSTINKIILTTAGDLTTASYAGQSVSLYSIFSSNAIFPWPSSTTYYPEAMAFDSTGYNFYAVNDDERLYWATLTTAWDLTTATDAGVLDLTPTDGNLFYPLADYMHSIIVQPGGGSIVFGSRSYGYVMQLFLSTNYDISSWSSFQSNQPELVLTGAGGMDANAGIYISNNGLTVTMLNTGGTMWKYNLTTPWDISTYDTESYNHLGTRVLTPPGSLQLKSGSFLNDYVVYGRDVSGDIKNVLAAKLPIGFYAIDVSASLLNTNTPWDVAMSSDGSKLFVLITGIDTVYGYDLAEPWVVTSANATENGIFSVSAQDTYPLGLAFNSDGSKMYILGTTGDDVNEYVLSTPWDITTSVYNSTYDTGVEATSPSAFAFSSNGLYMYVLDNSTDTTYQYNLATPWDLTTASYSGLSFLSPDSTATGIFMSTDGTMCYIVGQSTDALYQLTLLTPYNISTATLLKSIPFRLDTNPRGIYWDEIGSKFLVSAAAASTIIPFTIE